MKFIDAIEEALKNEQRLGDTNFSYDRDELNEFFSFSAQKPLSLGPENELSSPIESHRKPPSFQKENTKIPQAKFDATPRPVSKDTGLKVLGQKETKVESETEVFTPAESFSKQETKIEDEQISQLSQLGNDELISQALSCKVCLNNFKNDVSIIKKELCFVMDSVLSKGQLMDPLDGPSGDFFQKMLKAMKLTTEDYNIVQLHRCPRGSDLKEQSEAVLEIIRRLQPNCVVLYSPTILREISNFESLHEGRGTWINWNGTKVMPSYSPAFLMRSENVYGKSKKKEAWEDLQKVMSVL